MAKLSFQYVMLLQFCNIGDALKKEIFIRSIFFSVKYIIAIALKD